MLRLHTLGRLVLTRGEPPALEPLAIQPKRLALLAYLAVAVPRGLHRRDTLLALFWPELGQDDARRALRQALHHLRNQLGDGVIVSHRDETVGIAPGQLWSDVAALEQAAAQDLSADALELYQGDFLAGVFIPDVSQEFEDWVAQTRETLRRRTAAVAWSLAIEEELAGHVLDAAIAARRSVALDDSEPSVRRLMELLERLGDQSSALRTYRAFAERLEREFGAKPAKETQAVAARLRAMTEHQVAAARAVEPSAVGPATPSSLPVAPAKAPARAKRAVRVGALAAGGLLLLGAAGYAGMLKGRDSAERDSLLAHGVLLPRDRVIVADFTNHTTDSLLSAAITEAFRVDLAQSGAVRILSTSEVQSALRRMEKPSGAMLTDSLAREASLREGVKAFLSGDVAALGSAFAISVQLISAQTGEVLAAARETASDSTQIITAVDHLSKRVRGGIGESLRIVRGGAPLEQVTTSSLEALRKFAQGTRANDIEADYPRAILLLEEAVALDSTFAMAWRKLGAARSNTNMPVGKEDEALEMAYRHRDRLTERERLLATASYFDEGPGHDRARAISAYEAVLARDSTDHVALNNLAFRLVQRREFARAESLDKRAIDYGVAGVFEYTVLPVAAFNAGRAREAELAVAEARRHFPASPRIPTWLEGPRLYARGQLDSAAAVLDQARAVHDLVERSNAATEAANLALVQGQVARAARLFAEGRAIDSSAGAPAPAVTESLTSAFLDVWFRDNPKRAIRTLDAGLAGVTLRTVPEKPPTPFVDSRPYYFVAATIYARAARPDRARALLAQYDADVTDAARRRANEPERHNVLGEIALAEGRPRQAVAEFLRGDSLPDGPASSCAACLFARLGRAYERAAQRDSAIAMYERFLSTPVWFRLSPGVDASSLTDVYERLGELYEARGDTTHAALNYSRLLSLWRHADAELQPTVQRIAARLERLEAKRRDPEG